MMTVLVRVLSLAVVLLSASGVQVEAPNVRLVRKEALNKTAHEVDGGSTLMDPGTWAWCMSQVNQQLNTLTDIGGLTNTSKEARQLISLMQAVVEAMKVSSNQSSMVLNEFERLNANDYLCNLCTSAKGACVESVNQAALNAIPVILVKACDAVQHTLGGEVFSRATAAKFTPFANKAAQALACSELGLAPVKTEETARAETDRLGNLNTGTKSFLENGEQAMDGMASTFFFAMAAEHRLDYLDYLAPGAKVALLQEFGPAGGSSLTELSGEALEASMQRVVEQLRKSGSLAKAMSRVKIDSNNVRPHPYRPAGEGLDRRSSFAASKYPGTSSKVLDNIFVTRQQFDQGCSSPFPLGFLPAMTPPCYGHDICCECGQDRGSCDMPFKNAMVSECKRKYFTKIFQRLACQAQGRLMSVATWLWGQITDKEKKTFPDHCSNALAQDMMAQKIDLWKDLDPYFKV